MTAFLAVGNLTSCTSDQGNPSAQTANSTGDLLYMEDFMVAANRSSLFIRFMNDAGADGYLTMEVTFGEGLGGLTKKYRVPLIREPDKFKAAMDKLLATINDPSTTYINLAVEMQNCGWGFAR